MPEIFHEWISNIPICLRSYLFTIFKSAFLVSESKTTNLLEERLPIWATWTKPLIHGDPYFMASNNPSENGWVVVEFPQHTGKMFSRVNWSLLNPRCIGQFWKDAPLQRLCLRSAPKKFLRLKSLLTFFFEVTLDEQWSGFSLGEEICAKVRMIQWKLKLFWKDSDITEPRLVGCFLLLQCCMAVHEVRRWKNRKT